ncbi:winged helix-turn-helix transcriptional regulator [Candidatus Amarolinea aalborgensis]|uniref:winged helix-turn-helix domain-containing protein n=1 Tax=Candidatus Amarolinea aalborgensis TaxID=2249329 RepID=UPI003BF9ED92
MTPLEKFYTDDPRWHEKIGDIHALLERVKISEEQSGDVLHLRKLSRILSIHASTAIEGNRLTLGQVADVINGKYIDIATETRADVPVNVPVNAVSDKILILLRANPKATAQKLAQVVGVNDKTIKRHLKTLREQGRLERVGSDKTGHWEVIEGPP